MTIMRLLDIPPAEIGAGSEVWFDGREVLSLPDGEMRKIRGNEMAMIFQEPLTSLNPVFTVGDQIAEQVKLHMKVSQKEARDRAVEMLRLVGIPTPERRAKQYPHELSGGMRQRVMIGMALSCEPKLLIADEPTTALDVTVQAQILELLKAIQERTGAALMLITHDLGVVAEMVDNVIVMYAGQIVEQGTVEEVLLEPRMPYTMGLIESIPTVDEARRAAVGDQGRRPVAVPPAARLPVRAALPVCLGHLPDRAAGAVPGRRERPRSRGATCTSPTRGRAPRGGDRPARAEHDDRPHLRRARRRDRGPHDDRGRRGADRRARRPAQAPPPPAARDPQRPGADARASPATRSPGCSSLGLGRAHRRQGRARADHPVRAAITRAARPLILYGITRLTRNRADLGAGARGRRRRLAGRRSPAT